MAADMRQYSPHWFNKPTMAFWTAPESPKLEPQQVYRFMDRDSLPKKRTGGRFPAFSHWEVVNGLLLPKYSLFYR